MSGKKKRNLSFYLFGVSALLGMSTAITGRRHAGSIPVYPIKEKLDLQAGFSGKVANFHCLVVYGVHAGPYFSMADVHERNGAGGEEFNSITSNNSATEKCSGKHYRDVETWPCSHETE